jgi:hypothetical protein
MDSVSPTQNYIEYLLSGEYIHDFTILSFLNRELSWLDPTVYDRERADTDNADSFNIYFGHIPAYDNILDKNCRIPKLTQEAVVVNAETKDGNKVSVRLKDGTTNDVLVSDLLFEGDTSAIKMDGHWMIPLKLPRKFIIIIISVNRDGNMTLELPRGFVQPSLQDPDAYFILLFKRPASEFELVANANITEYDDTMNYNNQPLYEPIYEIISTSIKKGSKIQRTDETHKVFSRNHPLIQKILTQYDLKPQNILISNRSAEALSSSAMLAT